MKIIRATKLFTSCRKCGIMTKKVKGVGIMKKILTAMLAGALLLCTSCSGGESSSEAETEAVTEASKLGYDDVKAPVDAKWFDDAVFVGDSVTLKLNYYCAGSLGFESALWDIDREDAVHPYYKGSVQLVEDCVKLTGAKKVFVMLGMNDIGNYGTDGAMESARNLIGKLKSKSDGALIYLQSVTPILEGHEYDDLSNTHVRAFNEKLQAFCKEEGYKYLDIYSVMADENGYLRAEYCGDEEAQGIHFTDEACGIWADYLKQNV